MALVFQDALTALNAAFTVGWQIGEVLRIHRGMSQREAAGRRWRSWLGSGFRMRPGVSTT